MFPLLLFLVFMKSLVASEDNFCMKNQTMLQVNGDAVLTVFIDASFGSNCNESSDKGFQEMTTALYVTSLLNRHDYIPGITLGLKLMDTCHDSRSVYKHCLVTVAESDCTTNKSNHYYDLGILAPENYIPVLKPLFDFTELPISFYFNKNTTNPLISAAVYFIKDNYNQVELLLTDCDNVLDVFLKSTSDVGVCIKNINDLGQLNEESDGLIVVAAGEEMIRSWMQDEAISRRKTWLIIPLDDSELDEIVPVGSYVIRSESHGLDFEDYLAAESEDKIIHSPYFMGIGKAIVSIAELFSDIQKNNCPSGRVCSLPLFDTKLLKNHTISKVFEELKLPLGSQIVEYTVAQRIDPDVNDLEDILTYEVDIETFRVVTNQSWASLTDKCSKNDEDICNHCRNFEKKKITQKSAQNNSTDVKLIHGKSVFKSSFLVPVFLAFIGCGTIICIAVAAFIIYCYLTKDILDGNPTLTILLITGCIALLQSAIFFVLNEEYFGREILNSIKIFFSTLSIGFVFAIMVTRSFFLAFSTGGIFSSHINGYLQGIMLFFVTQVQMGMSTMYLLTSPENYSDAAKSPVFIGLLSYDIFLLVTLVAVSILSPKTTRNYQEGRCFYFTGIGIVGVWVIWIFVFLLVNCESRELIVAFGLILTGYAIISGTLAPRVYLMLIDLHGDNRAPVYIDGDSLGIRTQSINNRQTQRPFSDYTLPMKDVPDTADIHHHPRDLNFYGNSSFSRNQNQQLPNQDEAEVNEKISHYNNSGYHSDGQESENHYVVPKVSIEDARVKRKLKAQIISTDTEYAQPYSVSNYPDFREEKSKALDTRGEKKSKKFGLNRQGTKKSNPSRVSAPKNTHLATAEVSEENEDQANVKITRF